MRRLSLLMLYALLAGCGAEAQSKSETSSAAVAGALDCAEADHAVERQICADSTLRALDRQVAELWPQVSARAGRPTTLRHQHGQWLRDRLAGEWDWQDGGETRRPRDAEELRQFHEDYIEALQEEVRLAEGMPESVAVSSLADACVGVGLNQCSVPVAGFLNLDRERRLAWQVQDGVTEANGLSAGFVLFEVEGRQMRPVGWAYEGVTYEAPSLFETDQGTWSWSPAATEALAITMQTFFTGSTPRA
ncbi:hypothetical protein [Brevundimonas sp.]|uniref:hypothetical protein n=1 Tax=Brevundimonas sp. TaxID=1871086 RepID=UPI0025F1948F|nr:hypothetical protein [Brevundimonas sp.]